MGLTYSRNLLIIRLDRIKRDAPRVKERRVLLCAVGCVYENRRGARGHRRRKQLRRCSRLPFLLGCEKFKVLLLLLAEQWYRLGKEKTKRPGSWQARAFRAQKVIPFFPWGYLCA
jgi:hypothetical protein